MVASRHGFLAWLLSSSRFDVRCSVFVWPELIEWVRVLPALPAAGVPLLLS